MVFPSFSDTTNILVSSVPFPSSDPPPPPPPLPLIFFYWPTMLPTLLLTHFTWPKPLPPIPLKSLWWSLPDCLYFYALTFIAFAFVLSGIKPAHHCLSLSSLSVIFSEQIVWIDCLSGEGSFLQSGTEIMILHVR